MSASKYLNLEVKTSPHLERGLSVEQIMLNVALALVPVMIAAVYKYGISALALLVTTVTVCLVLEHFISRGLSRAKDGKPESTVSNYSALVTGILLGLTLPPGFPLWMAAVGAFFAIVVGKWAFGGLGSNPFNPALVGRIFLQAAFPVSITSWSATLAENRFTEFISTTLTMPFMKPVEAAADAFSGATPLGLMKFEHTFISWDILLGGTTTSGCIGEVSPILILMCGLYLAYRKMLDWRIPASIFLSMIVVSGIFYISDTTHYPFPLFMLLSGGVMLGAVFMATDMVSSPVTPVAIWIYGGLIGLLIVLIRFLGGLPEGVAYSIILANAVVPLLNKFAKTKVYGT